MTMPEPPVIEGKLIIDYESWPGGSMDWTHPDSDKYFRLLRAQQNAFELFAGRDRRRIKRECRKAVEREKRRIRGEDIPPDPDAFAWMRDIYSTVPDRHISFLNGEIR